MGSSLTNMHIIRENLLRGFCKLGFFYLRLCGSVDQCKSTMQQKFFLQLEKLKIVVK